MLRTLFSFTLSKFITDCVTYSGMLSGDFISKRRRFVMHYEVYFEMVALFGSYLRVVITTQRVIVSSIYHEVIIKNKINLLKKKISE